MLYGHLVGDLHPFHMNKEYAAKHAPGGQRIAHGMLTASLAVPSIVPIASEHAATHLEEKYRWGPPVYIGDTITTDCEIVELVPKKNWGLVRTRLITRNQRGEIVQEGESVLGIHYRPKGDE